MENKDLQPQASVLPSPSPVHTAPKAIPRVNPTGHTRTAGEKKFDRLTYTTVGYIINALLSVVAVYAVERTPGGQHQMDNAIEWTQKKFKNMNPDTAKMIATKSFFLTGGFLVMAPMKWLEDAKVRLVKKWDRQIYGDAVDTDPNIIKSHKELEAAPKQNWSSILGSRVLALIPFYVLVGALWDNKSSLSRMTNKNLQAVYKDASESFLHANPASKQNIFERLIDKSNTLRDAGHGWYARLTNAPLNKARSEALDTFIKEAPHEASKGIYFDHPISAASRYIGKKIAQLRGQEEVVQQIVQAEKEFPGMMTHPKFKDGPTKHDPNHAAVPYYFISEAITSGVVAWGVYALTRVLGPVLGKKQDALKPAVSELPDPAAPAVEEHPKVQEPVHGKPPHVVVHPATEKYAAENHARKEHMPPPEQRDEVHQDTDHAHDAADEHTPHTKVHTATLELHASTELATAHRA